MWNNGKEHENYYTGCYMGWLSKLWSLFGSLLPGFRVEGCATGLAGVLASGLKV